MKLFISQASSPSAYIKFCLMFVYDTLRKKRVISMKLVTFRASHWIRF